MTSLINAVECGTVDDCKMILKFGNYDPEFRDF